MKLLFALLLFCFAASFTRAQTTLVINTDNTNSKDAEIASAHAANNNYGNEQLHYVYSWTQSGTPVSIRTLLQIDLDNLPAYAVISSAELELYYDPAANPGLAGDNTFWLERITETWTESTVTWNNQPATDAASRATMQAYSTGSSVFKADVTALITAIRNSGNNYGFMMKLKTESPFINTCFGSTENTNGSLRPKLTIVYTMPTSVPEPVAAEKATLYPNPAQNSVAINIPTEKTAAVALYDNTGRLLWQDDNYTVNSPIATEYLDAGIYYAVASVNGIAQTLKFLKQ